MTTRPNFHTTLQQKQEIIVQKQNILVEQREPYCLRLTCHLLFPCLLYQSEFPTLFLAMREIIANASSVRISPRTDDKGTKKSDTPQGILEKYCAHKGTAPL